MTEKTIWMQRTDDAQAACKKLIEVCHGAGYENYQWHDLRTGEPLAGDGDMLLRHLFRMRHLVDDAAHGFVRGSTGIKTGQPELDEQLAEILLSLFDMAGAYKLDLGKALAGLIAYEHGFNSGRKKAHGAKDLPLNGCITA